jgi:hypothetical protein
METSPIDEAATQREDSGNRRSLVGKALLAAVVGVIPAAWLSAPADAFNSLSECKKHCKRFSGDCLRDCKKCCRKIYRGNERRCSFGCGVIKPK